MAPMRRMRSSRRAVPLIPTEDEEQEALFEWAASEPRPILRMMFAIPNGGYRNKATAVRMKRTGTKAGVPDIFLPVSDGHWHGLFIEMKRTKGGSVSRAQHDMIDALRAQGYRCEVCRGFEEARRVILDYIERTDAI